ncbi:hypothetical protein ACFQ21_04610 [Ohtaekwangia kribbensis]|uniref:Uncharacterized protein n=1 Tax=Ohtaekwangia kribbensis TaxID=688913 RepID=A0ABW3JXJ6_9BACT
MEQLLINQLFTLVSKAGGSSLIKDLIYKTNQNGNAKNWTVDEIENAINYLQNINRYFDEGDARVIIENLSKTYNLTTPQATIR